MNLSFIDSLHFIETVPAVHAIDGLGIAACAENYYHRKTEIFSYNWAAQDLEKDPHLASQSIAIVLSASEPF